MAAKAKEGAQKKDPMVRIRATTAMAELKVKFNKKYGVIKVVFGDLSIDDILEWL